MATGPGSNSFTATTPHSHTSTGGMTGNGYTCGTCGTWVPYGTYQHHCYGPTPTVYYTLPPVNNQPLIDAINELVKEVKKLQDIIADL